MTQYTCEQWNVIWLGLGHECLRYEGPAVVHHDSMIDSEGSHFLLQTLAVNSQFSSCGADVAIVLF